MAATIHVVRKDNIAEHTSISVSRSGLPALETGCISARTAIVSLTSNNLAYAQMGSMLHFWDAFPAPDDLPVPYNDQTQYGIVPAWGYAEVLESKVAGIDTGRLLWGYWPTHDRPVVLELKKAGLEGHYIDTTPSRSKMMTLYHRYEAAPPHLNLNTISQSDLDALAWDSVAITAPAGWTISRYVFGDLAIHPFGARGSGSWTKEEADLSKAVVVSMSASGKTARGFTNAVLHDRKPGTGPLGLLAVTGGQDPDLVPKASFATKVIAYLALEEAETTDWIKDLSPRKIIVLDFGGRGDSLPILLKFLSSHLEDVPVTIIGIGSEMKALSSSEKAAQIQKGMAMPNRTQMNTSGVWDEAMRLLGEEKFFEEKKRGWESFLKNGGLKGLKLEWGEGMKGIQEGWKMLCEQKVSSDVGMVFRSDG